MRLCVCAVVGLMIAGVALAGEAKSDSYDKSAVDAAMARMLEKQRAREAEKKAATTQPAVSDDVDKPPPRPEPTAHPAPSTPAHRAQKLAHTLRPLPASEPVRPGHP